MPVSLVRWAVPRAGDKHRDSQSRSAHGSAPATSSRSYRGCSACAARQRSCGAPMVRSSSPRRCSAGCVARASRPRTSSPGSYGRTASPRASSTACATSASVSNGSTTASKPRSSSKLGARNTATTDRTAASATRRQHSKDEIGTKPLVRSRGSSVTTNSGDSQLEWSSWRPPSSVWRLPPGPVPPGPLPPEPPLPPEASLAPHRSPP